MSVDHIFKKAVNLHNRGQYQQAGKLYKKILKTHPNHPDVLHLMGLASFQRSDYQSAVKFFRRAISAQPGNPDFHNDCGEAYRKLNQFDKAISCYHKALELNPDLAGAHNNLGIVYNALGQHDKSLAHYHQALTLQPDNVEARYNLAHSLQKQEQFEDSAEHYRKVLALNPQFAEAHINLGNICKNTGQLDEAIEHYRQALAINPALAECHINIGAVLKTQDRTEEAISSYEKAIELNENLAGAYYNIGELYERINRLNRAKHYVEKLLQVDPQDPYGRRLAATLLRREGNYKEALDQLKDIELVKTSADAVQDIHFELGQIHDRLNEPAQAFEHFVQANRLQAADAESLAYDRDLYLNDIAKLTKLFSEAGTGNVFFKASNPDTRKPPVFLVGFPRSGTTLLDQILDSHAQIRVLEEKPVLEHVISVINEKHGGYPDALLTLDQADISALQQEYFNRLEEYLAGNQGAGIIVDKFPLNIIHAGLIHILFPAAKLIVAVRHPLDVCLSCFMQPFKANPAMVNFNTIEDSAGFYDRVMNLWQCYERLLPLDSHILRYESLVTDLRGEVENLLRFLELEWDASVLDYAQHASGRGQISTPSYHQVTQPVYQSSRYRWQCYREQLEPIIDSLGPYIKYFGY